MTLPMQPAPFLSPAAQPMPRVVLPDSPPDPDEVARFFGNGAQPGRLRERDLRERDLLGMAMASPHGVAALRQLRPEEFTVPVNQNVARAILDLADQGRPHDAAAVTAELRARPLPGADGSSQLPAHLDPLMPRRTVDPRAYGLGAWENNSLAPAGRAPLVAREIRALARQDAAVQAAYSALHDYRRALAFDQTGRLEQDGVGLVTKELADKMVSLPKQLQADIEEMTPWESPTRSRSLGLPSPPNLSRSGREALRPARA